MAKAAAAAKAKVSPIEVADPFVRSILTTSIPDEPEPKAEPKPKGKSGGTFHALSAELATADAEARAASSDAGQARAKRSTVAVSTILAAFHEAVAGSDVRGTLLSAGVLKGTVSKIVTVLESLNAGHITTGDVKSLNGAYNLVKDIAKAHAGGVATPGGGILFPAAPATTAMPPAKAITPDEALKIIIATITSEKNPDKMFKLGGEWITKCTNAITLALKSAEEEE